MPFDSPHHQLQSYTPLFLFTFLKLRKVDFTSTSTTSGRIHRFSNPDNLFSRKPNVDPESAQKTEYNEVFFKVI